ncbi:MAG: hypothetical protein K2M59_03955 [Muribaculaceae bacterium]|nr:hypothetical protein [Muribaculaceae bacterium]MDE7465565.1 hypothetical protein [Muribaculaceae bacterium]
MRTKFKLHYDNSIYELQDDDLYNWDEIKCSYKRADFDGVVRSFSSQFSFVNRAKDILMMLYLRDGFNAGASVSVHTLTDDWKWEERFSCPLDFSTITWEQYILQINAVDNSLAALIKANKGTKYEFTIGSEIIRDNVLRLDRIPMLESVTYEFTQGESYEDSGDIRVTFTKDQLPWLGYVAKEISINRAIYFKDDQENEPDSYLLRAEKDIDITLNYEFEWRTNSGQGAVDLGIFIKRNGSYLSVTEDNKDGTGGGFALISVTSLYKVPGPITNPDELPDPSTLTEPQKANCYALIHGIVWYLTYGHGGYTWQCTDKTESEYFVSRTSGKMVLKLKAGDLVVIRGDVRSGNYANIRFIRSSINIGWLGTGISENVDVLKPVNVAKHLLQKIAGEDVSISVEISAYDPRIANTYIMAAESLRGITCAKLYSSFTEFCEWMSAVFGYIYYIGEIMPDGSQSVYFVHRSEVLDSSADTRLIRNCNDVKYSVDTSVIYSTVTIGYDHKDYDSINGRDEFNFSNTYTTGCSVTDKTLSLISKYRADCYGIEFALQKRGENTTDSSSDKDVFFTLCKESTDTLVIDNSTVIENALTDSVFNAAFCPMACVRANAGFIGMQADGMTLKFASSTGNSDVVIGGEPMTADITIDTPLATAGCLEFSTDDLDDAMALNDMIEVTDDNGILYRGFIKEVDFKYARNESVKYKLIVKDIDQ